MYVFEREIYLEREGEIEREIDFILGRGGSKITFIVKGFIMKIVSFIM